MENKELWNKKFEERITITSIEVNDASTDGDMTIGLGKSHKIKLSAHHNQDCCEHVYADFSPVGAHKERLEGKKLDALTIKGVSGMGFLLVFETGYDEFEKIFVPCYNSQTGYYSSNLELVIQEDLGAKVMIDISSFVEDLID